jgi:hypothetical protein
MVRGGMFNRIGIELGRRVEVVKMKRKVKWIITIVVVAIVIASAYYVLYHYLPNVRRERRWTYLRYSVEINVNETFDYTVYVPLLINENGIVLNMIHEPQILDGVIAYEVLETEHGKALKIVGRGDVAFCTELNSDGDFSLITEGEGQEGILHASLSMWNGSCVADEWRELWTYSDIPSNMSNMTVHVSLTMVYHTQTVNGFGKVIRIHSPGLYITDYLKYNVTNGWQKVIEKRI